MRPWRVEEFETFVFHAAGHLLKPASVRNGQLTQTQELYIFLSGCEKQKSEEIEAELENLSCLYRTEAFPCALCVFYLFSNVQGKEVEEVTTLN